MRAIPAARGRGEQRPRREQEKREKKAIIALSDAVAEAGGTRQEVAEGLDIPARTIRHWRLEDAESSSADTIRYRGRKPERAPLVDREELLEHVRNTGATLAIKTYQKRFRHMARREVANIVHRVREVIRRRGIVVERLRWLRPGGVWAIDFAHADGPLEEGKKAILSVRDLGAGVSLRWRPVEAMTAEVVVGHLEQLFRMVGAPMVLKLDNGIDTDAVRELCKLYGVLPLVSPPYWPRYNGCVERGIGILKVASGDLACFESEDALWTTELLERVHEAVNEETPHPAFRGVSRGEVWRNREPLKEIERTAFLDDVSRYRTEAQEARKLLPRDLETRKISNSVDRVAILRALVKHGFLAIEKRTIHPRVTTQRAAKNA